MPRRFPCFALVIALLAANLIGSIAAPDRAHGAVQDSDFSAAETMIAHTGTYGHWAFHEPLGFPPVQCAYFPSDETSQLVTILTPDIYPVDGFSNQKVSMGVRTYRRLPDGSRQLIFNFGPTPLGQTSFGAPIPGSNRSTGTDRGSTIVASVTIQWFDFSGTNVIGSVELLYNHYQTLLPGPPIQALPMTDACYPALPAVAKLGVAQGTVNQSIPFTINRFPENPAVSIYFDSQLIGSVATNAYGNGTGSFTVPAAPMGQHTIKFYRFGRQATDTFTVKPRIKIIPSENIARDQTVNVSLRGYKARETVRIRWKKGTSWVELARVTTSSTGSANINVKVPNFVPNGPTSVRGDSLNASGGRAQTNAVTVLGGPFSSSSAKPTATTTRTAFPTMTPSPIATSAPPTSTMTPTESATEPTSTATTTEPTATEATSPDTATPTATVEATVPEPTVAPTETPESTD
jgi:hypothetical protein